MAMFLNSHLYNIGYGSGGTYVAEAYIVGGFCGVVLISLLIGAGLQLLYTGSRTADGLFVVAMVLPEVLWMSRGSLLGWVSVMIRNSISIFLLILGWWFYISLFSGTRFHRPRTIAWMAPRRSCREAVVVSLIVATLNRIAKSTRLLTSLDGQNYKQFEVIVVDQNPDERLVPVFEKHPGLVMKHLRSQPGISRRAMPVSARPKATSSRFLTMIVGIRSSCSDRLSVGSHHTPNSGYST